MSLSCIEGFLTTVDPKRTTVVSFTDYLLVFGGRLSPSPLVDPPASQRDAFIDWLKANRSDLNLRVIFPETFEDWKDFNTYSDLLLFEKDLGYLTSVVIVFLEGPGSIAELGAFSQIESLWRRILVVIARNRNLAKSFITLGPLRSIRETNKQHDAICVISDETAESVVEDIEVIVQAVEDRQARRANIEAFDSQNPQHQIFLVLDLINLFLFIQISELEHIVNSFSSDLGPHRLRQIIFLLNTIGLVCVFEYGNTTYYTPPDKPTQFLGYTATVGRPSFDRVNITARAFGEIQSSNIRRKAYAAFMKTRSTA